VISEILAKSDKNIDIQQSLKPGCDIKVTFIFMKKTTGCISVRR